MPLLALLCGCGASQARVEPHATTAPKQAASEGPDRGVPEAPEVVAGLEGLTEVKVWDVLRHYGLTPDFPSHPGVRSFGVSLRDGTQILFARSSPSTRERTAGWLARQEAGGWLLAVHLIRDGQPDKATSRAALDALIERGRDPSPGFAVLDVANGHPWLASYASERDEVHNADAFLDAVRTGLRGIGLECMSTNVGVVSRGQGEPSSAYRRVECRGESVLEMGPDGLTSSRAGLDSHVTARVTCFSGEVAREYLPGWVYLYTAGCSLGLAASEQAGEPVQLALSHEVLDAALAASR